MNSLKSNVYQAIQQINLANPAQVYEIEKITHLTQEQIKIALKELLEDNLIKAKVIPSTGKNDYGEPLDFSDIEIL